MINPHKSHLKKRKLKYDETYKNKRLNIYKNKYAIINYNPYDYIYLKTYFKDPEQYLEYLEDKIIDTTGYERQRYKKDYWYYRKLPGKLIKTKYLLTTPDERCWVSEKVEYLSRLNKKYAKEEVKDYFSKGNNIDA